MLLRAVLCTSASEFARIIPANAVVPITLGGLIVYIPAIITSSTEWVHGHGGTAPVSQFNADVSRIVFVLFPQKKEINQRD